MCEYEYQIEIEIRGKPGSGKSTVAHAIASKLVEAGFEVELQDYDDTPTVARPLASLKAMNPICVKTVQEGR